MGIDIYALITDWEPAVEAYRAAGGLDFYWDASAQIDFEVERAGRQRTPLPWPEVPEVVPFAEEQWARKAFTAAGTFYRSARMPSSPASTATRTSSSRSLGKCGSLRYHAIVGRTS